MNCLMQQNVSLYVMAVDFMLISEYHQNHELEQEEKQENEHLALLGSETSLCKDSLHFVLLEEGFDKLIHFSLA